MATHTVCQFCQDVHLNFGDDNANMWLDETVDGEHCIVADPPYAWSIPINYCPFCGRDLMKKVDE